MKLAPDEEYWEIGNQWRRLMREIVYSRCSETRILATARILIRCERRGDDDPYSLVLSSLSVSLTSYSTWRCIQRGSKQIAIWNLNISVSKLFGSRKYLNQMSVELGQTIPPTLDSRPLDLDPDSFVCSAMLGTQPEELILPLSFFWPRCHFCLTK